MFWPLLGAGLVFVPAIQGLAMFGHWSQISTNSLASLAAIELHFVAFAAALFGLVIGAVLSRIPRSRRYGFLMLLLALLFLGTLRPTILLGTRLRMAHLSELGAQAMPLVDAIKAFEAREGHPPPELAALTPEYLGDIPYTGIAANSDFDYLTGEAAGLWFDNPRVLRMTVQYGTASPGHVMYFPLQNYPPGNRFERLGAWGYIHE